jgi:hypothetical protein
MLGQRMQHLGRTTLGNEWEEPEDVEAYWVDVVLDQDT